MLIHGWRLDPTFGGDPMIAIRARGLGAPSETYWHPHLRRGTQPYLTCPTRYRSVTKLKFAFHAASDRRFPHCQLKLSRVFVFHPCMRPYGAQYGQHIEPDHASYTPVFHPLIEPSVQQLDNDILHPLPRTPPMYQSQKATRARR
jgi:hypothetical protein